MHKLLAFFFVLFFIMSCSNSDKIVIMKATDSKWDKKAEQKFDFNISDAQSPKNIIFVVRNNNDYPYSNIRLFVNFINNKTKKKNIDTLNYVLAKPNGDWIGTGFGETKETLFQYKLNYKFPENGSYTIGVLQAMRKDLLPGIEDIGIKIESAKP